ncbi:ubiquinone/menaquinone biosynthesis C-methylase UbiE [Paenibacillus castaneae]|uniref:class I SAM-dependent methyltransferase n=1 Tax=Paenibacillus castaneae TaxID=474957 RepID=UPI001FB8DE07|nr:methyltransferase domain-containing protein [Paenibacillus castaneae]NIK80241.1 ubiquinone/menaquinone biosynthesis C-methylase UbiE [Paenibacillus castaneae]
MKHSSTYNIQNSSIGLEAEIIRLKVQALMAWEKEYRSLQWFGLQDGMMVLDAGCGPGFVTEKLMESLPNSEITALDIDEQLINQAKSRLEPLSEARLHFVQASIYNTGFQDEVFDFVIVRLLFLHLHHPLEAAKELMRILKPGGKLVIIDIDDGLFGVIHPDMDDLPSILQKIARSQHAKGGNRYIGRSLPRLLTEAGYRNVDMDAIIQHSDLHGVEGFKQQFNTNRFKGMHDIGIISDSEFESMKKSYEELSNSEQSYAMMIFFIACGSKPLGDL